MSMTSRTPLEEVELPELINGLKSKLDGTAAREDVVKAMSDQ
jgi:hypothetical protein